MRKITTKRYSMIIEKRSSRIVEGLGYYSSADAENLMVIKEETEKTAHESY